MAPDVAGRTLPQRSPLLQPLRPSPSVPATAAWAAVLSGIPSTTWALLTRADALAAARAAGTLLPGRRDRPGLLAGAVVHVAVTLGWTAVLLPVLRRAPAPPLAGAAAGAAIAALDLGVVAPRWRPAVRALPQGPQWGDHLAFGVVVGLAARRATPSGR